MGRRKITDEARKEVAETSESEDDSERKEFTTRMDETRVERLDEYADKYGMSRNAVINSAVERFLDDQGI